MRYTAEQYAAALYYAVNESRADGHERILDNFVQILREQKALSLFDEIEQAYLRLEKKSRGVVSGEISSAKPISASAQAELIEKLNSHIAGKVELKAKIDEGLVGGFVVRVGDMLIDGSTKKGLNELKRKMTE